MAKTSSSTTRKRKARNGWAKGELDHDEVSLLPNKQVIY